MLAAIFFIVVRLGGTPLVPLMIGCIAAAVVAAAVGFRWEEILRFMLEGIYSSVEAILILLLIGCLVGVWIAAGTVPSLIYYGLCILNAKYFLAASALICAVVSFALGAWGTVGTVGIALVGIGTALQIPLPMVAGSIVSGAYFGDAVSPLSDTTNLTSAVVEADVFSVVKKRLVPILTSFGLALAAYLALGLFKGSGDGAEVAAAVEPLKDVLCTGYRISPLCLIPLGVILICIFAKLPAIPSVLAGVVSGVLTAVFLQHTPAALLLSVITDGNISTTGSELADLLFTAGGISSMMNTVSIVLVAMAFGGLMKNSGQMQALIAPLAKKLRSFRSLHCTTALSCLLMNVFLPDQYLAISVPGQMFMQEYDDRGYDRSLFGTGLVGAALTSPLVPWNTCGLYCLSLLGVSAREYLPYAFFNLLGFFILLLYGFLFKPARQRKNRIS